MLLSIFLLWHNKLKLLSLIATNKTVTYKIKCELVSAWLRSIKNKVYISIFLSLNTLNDMQSVCLIITYKHPPVLFHFFRKISHCQHFRLFLTIQSYLNMNLTIFKLMAKLHLQTRVILTEICHVLHTTVQVNIDFLREYRQSFFLFHVHEISNIFHIFIV